MSWVGRGRPVSARLAEGLGGEFQEELDTLDPCLHSEICGVDDLPAVLEALGACVATDVPVKVNTVVMAGVNDHELADLATFCERLGVNTLKLLDVIKDLDAGAESFARRMAIKRGRAMSDLYLPLHTVAEQFSHRAVCTEMRTQGGLGHPMTVLTMPSGFEIVTKDSRAGAWYGEVCNGCPFFPCHDALMALRLTADRRLQYCLLREDITVPLDGALAADDESELTAMVERAVQTYASATFRQPAEAQPLAVVTAP